MRLSQFILLNMEPILQEWENFARSLGPVTATMDTVGLRDHAELMLRELVADLETPQNRLQQQAKSLGNAPQRAANQAPAAATSHGATRAEEGFSLEQMVAEYRALRASVLRLWANVQPTPDESSFQELMRFNEAIDEALAASIKYYSDTVDQMGVTKTRQRMETLGTLSAGLGHDMVNVLMPMRACVSALAHKAPMPATAPLIKTLQQALDYLSTITKGLHALSLDVDSTGSKSEAVVLHEWWSGAISPFTWVLPKGVRLHAEGLSSEDQVLPPVLFPAHVLLQAVFNLVQNAAQAIVQHNGASRTKPTGNVWISAHLHHEPPTHSSSGKGAVRLTVRDDGPGMDAHATANCMNAFYTSERKGCNTGLGLYVVRTLVERQGGRLVVESEEGKGSAFSLLLPIAS